jgi:hypothetical protein
VSWQDCDHAMKTHPADAPVALDHEVNRIQDFNTAEFHNRRALST